MTLSDEITRIQTNIANTYTALGEKGATMPETMNSDNLADTVATVSTGGGSVETVVRGGWIVPQEYLYLDKLCSSTDGFTEIPVSSSFSNNPSVILGVVYRDSVKRVRISKNNNTAGFVCPEGCVVEMPNGGNNMDIYFPDDSNFKYFAVVKKLPYNTSLGLDTVSSSIYVNSGSTRIATGNSAMYNTYVKYFTLNNLMSENVTRNASSPHVNFSAACGCALDDCHIVNFTPNWNISYSDMAMYSLLSNQDFLKQYAKTEVIDCKYISVSNRFWAQLYSWKSFPFILDLSERTSTDLLTIGSSDGFSYNNGVIRSQLFHVRIKLPSTHSITFADNSFTWGGFWPDYETLDYMLANAPNVDSSLGLTVKFSATDGAVEGVYPGFSAAMADKGWAITES